MVAFGFHLSALAQAPRKQVNVDIQKQERKSGKKEKIGRDGKTRISRAEIFAVEVERKLIQGINTTIKALHRTASRFPKKSAERYEVLKKLLHLYLENAAYVASDESRSYDQKWSRWDAGGRRGPEPRLNTKGSMGLWQRLANQAEGILKEYPRAKDADEIMFNQALALQFLGKEQDAAKAFSNIIKLFPNSPFAGDSYFSLGDYYFDRNDFTNSLNNYRSALRYTKSKRYGWALFKLGWAYYNMGNYAQSLAHWKKTVDYSRKVGDKTGSRLREEALRDMVFAFAELKQVEPAISYYRRNGGSQYIGKFLLLLGSTFSDQGQFDGAISVYKRYQQLLPYGEEAPQTQIEICTLLYELSRFKPLWAEVKNLSSRYGPQSAWAKKNGANKKLVSEVQIKIKEQMLYYPKITHNQAKNNAAYSEALIGYNLFLASYGKAREVPEIQFLMADILFFRKQYLESGQLYLKIASLPKNQAVIYGKKGVQENIHKKSAQYMLDAFLKDFEPELKKLSERKVTPKSAPIPVSVKANNFIKGCGAYAKWYPDDQKSIRSCEILTAEIYFRSNNPNAKKYLWVIAKKYSSGKEGKQAIENLIPLYGDDKKGLLLAVEEALKIPAYQKGELGKRLRDLKNAAETEAIAREKDDLKRGQMYENQAKKLPNSPEADKMWNNAAVDYLKAGAIPQAIVAYLSLANRYPKSPLYGESLLQAAKLYDRMLEFDKAAKQYLLFASKDPKAKEAPGALARACELSIASQMPEMEKVCGDFVARFPDGGEPLIYNMIRVAELGRDYGQMARVINNLYLPKLKLSPSQQIAVLYKIYRASGKRGQVADKSASDMMRVFQSNKARIQGEAVRHVGEVVFHRVKDISVKYKAITLKGGTVDAMVASIGQKGGALDQLKSRYNDVFQTEDPYWGSAALYQIGEAYEELAQMLNNPPGIQGATVDDVRKELAPQAAAALKESKAYYQRGYEAATRFNIYNEWSVQLLAGLARVDNKKVSFVDIVVTPDFLGARIPSEIASGVN
jgi:TolA-binding protein